MTRIPPPRRDQRRLAQELKQPILWRTTLFTTC